MKRYEKLLNVLTEKDIEKRKTKIEALSEKEVKLLLNATLEAIKQHNINEL